MNPGHRRMPRRRPRPRLVDGSRYIMNDAVSPSLDTAFTADGFNPLLHLSTAFGLPGVIWSAIYPQVQQLARKWPTIWRLLSVGVAAHLIYQYTWQKIIRTLKYLLSFCASSIKIYESDELMGCFTRWVDSQNPGLIQDSFMTGQSRQYRNINKDLEDQDVSFRSKSTSVKPTNFVLERSYNVRLFRYKKRIFWISHDFEKGFNWEGQREDKRCLNIWTLGRSVKPIADILDEAVEGHANDGEKSATTMYIPSGSSGDWMGPPRGSSGMWITRTVKPCRPIDTVYLDGDQRQMIIKDVERFLHPDTALRYRKKGIPHRRGYLYSGPPGNGKSSLAMALAGHFGLNVYSLSLRDPNMSDSYLGSLMNVLPPNKVLVLLEDVDSSGLRREEEFVDDLSDIDSLDPRYQPRRIRVAQRPVNITLSGVLNAIDGISAPEGHILIMTTNAPEKLDKALIRPGRIDVKIDFKNASQSQLQAIFERMYRYEGDAPQEDSAAGAGPSTVKFATEPTDKKSSSPESSVPFAVLPTHAPRLPTAELNALATSFSTAIPSQACSLAEVQNYLLGRVDDPERAVREAPNWAEELSKEKAAAEESKKQKALDAALEQEKFKQRMKEARLNGSPGILDSGFGYNDDLLAKTPRARNGVKVEAAGGGDLGGLVNGVSDIEPINGSALAAEAADLAINDASGGEALNGSAPEVKRATANGEESANGAVATGHQQAASKVDGELD